MLLNLKIKLNTNLFTKFTYNLSFEALNFGFQNLLIGLKS